MKRNEFFQAWNVATGTRKFFRTNRGMRKFNMKGGGGPISDEEIRSGYFTRNHGAAGGPNEWRFCRMEFSDNE